MAAEDEARASGESTHVLVADPAVVMRTAVRALLTTQSDFGVTEASDTETLLHVLETEPVDIALVDLDLAPHGGIAAIEQIPDSCKTKIVIWSNEPSRQAVLAGIRAGAVGYLSKQVSPDALVSAFESIRKSESPLSRFLTDGIERPIPIR